MLTECWGIPPAGVPFPEDQPDIKYAATLLPCPKTFSPEREGPQTIAPLGNTGKVVLGRVCSSTNVSGVWEGALQSPIPCSGHGWDAPREPSHPGAGQEPVQALQDGSRVLTKLKETHLSPVEMPRRAKSPSLTPSQSSEVWEFKCANFLSTFSNLQITLQTSGLGK